MTIPVAGAYELSVYAASPSGFVIELGVPKAELVQGGFGFFVDGEHVGVMHVPELDAGWVRYTARFEVTSPGEITAGVGNITGAPYFINYDSLELVLVPEPSSLLLGSLVLVGLLLGWRQST